MSYSITAENTVDVFVGNSSKGDEEEYCSGRAVFLDGLETFLFLHGVPDPERTSPRLVALSKITTSIAWSLIREYVGLGGGSLRWH